MATTFVKPSRHFLLHRFCVTKNEPYARFCPVLTKVLFGSEGKLVFLGITGLSVSTLKISEDKCFVVMSSFMCIGPI
jgi:hypothetical protein